MHSVFPVWILATGASAARRKPEVLLPSYLSSKRTYHGAAASSWRWERGPPVCSWGLCSHLSWQTRSLAPYCRDLADPAVVLPAGAKRAAEGDPAEAPAAVKPKAEAGALPPGWSTATDAQGRTYYWCAF